MRREQFLFDMEEWVANPELNGVSKPMEIPVNATANGHHDVPVEDLQQTPVVNDLSQHVTAPFNPHGDRS